MNKEIRIITPARTISFVSSNIREIANKNLERLGLNVTFGNNVEETNKFMSSSIKSRINDLHKALENPNVKIILTGMGGFNSNELLEKIDYELIKKNPKPIVGFSDITVISNAIFSKTGIIGYSGPVYATFGMEKGLEYTLDYFKKCVLNKEPFDIKPSNEWSDDEWFKDQKNREFIPNKGIEIIQEGEAQGTIIGGNLCTFSLLLGTEFKPSFKNTILFLEDDNQSGELFMEDFDRELTSILQQKDFSGIKAIIIGRAQKKTNFTIEKLKQIIKSKEKIKNIPIIYGLDFGHTSPMITFPIGGECKLIAKNKSFDLKIIKH